MLTMNARGDSPPVERRSLLERIDGLADVIRTGGDEAQQLRRCPTSVIEALIDEG